MFRKALFVLLMFVPCIAFADTIYLKNGKAIKEVEAIEDGSFVRYMKFGQEISIPKASVERIERIVIEKSRLVGENEKNDEHIEEPNLDTPQDLSTCEKIYSWEMKLSRYRAYLNKTLPNLKLRLLQLQQNEAQDSPEAKELDKEIRRLESQERLVTSIFGDLKTKKGNMSCKN